MQLLTRSFTKTITAAAVLLTVTFVPSSGLAQTSARDTPPYEDQLLRLAEVFGALHFLRPLCGHKDDPSWRAQMQSLIDTEISDENRRRRFVERFNLGYRGFSTVYRECTDAARLALKQYADEGSTLISDVTSRYGR